MNSAWKTTVSALLLVLTALIWGVAFVAQSVGSDSVGPFTFLCCRSMIAGTALLPVIALRSRRSAGIPRGTSSGRGVWLGGCMCGAALMAASTLQQIGIAGTTVGKAGFLTALYIVIVPLFGIFLKKKIPLSVWAAVLIAACGMYLLCINEGFTVSRGDGFMLLCAVCFSVHILTVDHFSPHADGIRMSCIQFYTCGLLSLFPMLLWEKPQWQAISDAWIPILYAGLFSSAVGYTLQIVAQKNVPPTVASLLMSLESVFSALAGWVILHESLSAKELTGCALVFLAILLAQLPASFFAALRTRLCRRKP